MVISIMRYWSSQALILLLILDLGSCASVSDRSKGERVDPAASAYDDEASVQDDDQLYHNVAESNSQFPSSKDLGVGGEESGGSADLTYEDMDDTPMYMSPYPGSFMGAEPWEGNGMVPIDLPLRRDLVRKIVGESDGQSMGGDGDCSHCKCGGDFHIPDGFVYDPVVAAASDVHRSKRSTDDYWYSLGRPSKHLERHDVHYAIRNDLRKRLEKTSYPLHNGHIYTGHIGDPYDYDAHDRAFGPDADFNFPYDVHAFKYKPHGPRLNHQWRKYKYPVYSHNLYKLREYVKAMEFGQNGKGQVVTLSGGVYRFVSVTKKGDVLMTNVKTHKKFLVPELFVKPKESRKFQALGPWKDPNGVYLPVSASGLGGNAYIIKGSPLTGNNPKKGNHLLYHGLHTGHPAPPGSVLDRKHGKKSPEGLKGAPKHH